MNDCVGIPAVPPRIPSPSSPLATVTRFIGLAALAALTTASFRPGRARANPVLGFIEEFPGTSTGTWAGNTPKSNPGTGGYLGASDGYLRLQNSAPAQFGARSEGVEYTGNWTASGITQVRVWLNDVGADDPLEMHFALGNDSVNFWQYNVGFLPPLHAWGEYVVTFGTGSDWTQIGGTTGTFANALANVDRILLRHDPPPYAIIPDLPDEIAADVGIDHLLLTNGLVGVDPLESRALHPVELAVPYPNPSRGPVSLTVRAADAGAIRIEIVDAAGRSVRRVELADAGSGPRTWLWDGLDAGGRRLAAGIYRVRATGASGGMSQPLARIN